MRIVIDSNVWISALVFGGNPRKILEKTVTDGWIIIMSEEILTEIRRILDKKFPDFVDDFEAFYAILLPRMMVVPLGRIRVNVSRDEDDNRIVETAMIGKAPYIISGDKDLLVIETYEGIRIMTPTDFLSNGFAAG